MRYVLGLGGLLMTLVGFVVFFAAPGGYLDYTRNVAKTGKLLESQARQVAGVDFAGRPVGDSVSLETVYESNRFKALRAAYVLPKGIMAIYYGLETGDVILRAGDIGVTDNNDPDLGKALVLEAYQRQWPLLVVRGGLELLLPRDRTSPPPAAGSGAAGTSAAGTGDAVSTAVGSAAAAGDTARRNSDGANPADGSEGGVAPGESLLPTLPAGSGMPRIPSLEKLGIPVANDGSESSR